LRMHSLTAASISRAVIPSRGRAPRTTTGLLRAGAGKSHSWETPANWSARPRAQAISVAAGRKETMRRSFIQAINHKTKILWWDARPAWDTRPSLRSAVLLRAGDRLFRRSRFARAP